MQKRNFVLSTSFIHNINIQATEYKSKDQNRSRIRFLNQIKKEKKKITDGQVAGTRPGFGANITYCLLQVVRFKRYYLCIASFYLIFCHLKLLDGYDC